MTTYTDTHGTSTMLCDHCRCDLNPGSSAFMLSPGKVAAGGYCSRDYDRGEMILCPDCAKVIGQVMSILGVKRADNLILVQEAA